MATFTAHSYRVKMPELGAVFDFSGAAFQNFGFNNFRVDYTYPGYLDVFGYGFAYGAGNKPSAGVVNYMATRDDANQPIWEFSGMSLTVAQFFNFANGNHQAGLASIFSGRDTINGSSQGDILDGYGNADVMRGGHGSDTYRVNHAGDRVFESDNQGTYDLVQSSVSYKLRDAQTIGIEKVQLVGNKTINVTGSVFDDILYGNSKNNVLSGLGGNDTLRGGSGADTFMFREAVSLDKILDFNRVDRIVLDDQLYQDFDHRGRLHANEFKDIGRPGARVDSDDIILYNSKSGALYYDWNGNGLGGRTHIITVVNKADVNFDDIFIV